MKEIIIDFNSAKGLIENIFHINVINNIKKMTPVLAFNHIKDRCNDIDFVESLMLYDIMTINTLNDPAIHNEIKTYNYYILLMHLRALDINTISKVIIRNKKLAYEYINAIKIIIVNFRDNCDKSISKLDKACDVANKSNKKTISFNNKLNNLEDICKVTGLTKEELKNIIYK